MNTFSRPKPELVINTCLISWRDTGRVISTLPCSLLPWVSSDLVKPHRQTGAGKINTKQFQVFIKSVFFSGSDQNQQHHPGKITVLSSLPWKKVTKYPLVQVFLQFLGEMQRTSTSPCLHSLHQPPAPTGIQLPSNCGDLVIKHQGRAALCSSSPTAHSLCPEPGTALENTKRC